MVEKTRKPKPLAPTATPTRPQKRAAEEPSSSRNVRAKPPPGTMEVYVEVPRFNREARTGDGGEETEGEDDEEDEPPAGRKGKGKARGSRQTAVEKRAILLQDRLFRLGTEAAQANLELAELYDALGLSFQ